MTQKKTNELESLRLEYCFDHGVNVKQRTILITGEIEQQSSFDLLDAAMNEMEAESRKAITVKINSPGGSVYEALAMIDRMQESPCIVTTKCYGHAMSAAGLLLTAGNKRYMGSRGWFMHHEISMIAGGTLSKLEEEVAQAKREMQQWAITMAEFTKRDAEFWLAAAKNKDFYLSAEQCLELGVVDGLL